MKWGDDNRSRNLEDRRFQRVPAMGAAGGGLGLLMRFLPMLLRTRMGRYALGAVVVGVLGAKAMGIDLLPMLLGAGAPAMTQAPSSGVQSNEEAEAVEFVSRVLADTEVTWHSLLNAEGKNYIEPKLVLFRNAVQSGCGFAKAAMGPFYCPADQKIYIDLSFFEDLRQRHQAPGDFAQAYVIAHEVGHHIQTLMGISQQVHAAKANLSQKDANVLSVKQELQADCFAGVWGHFADKERNRLEAGDLDEALNAASAIGDDRLQQQGQGYVVPDSFTHGSAEQRVQWFRKGFASGNLAACDTFTSVHL